MLSFSVQICLGIILFFSKNWEMKKELILFFHKRVETFFKFKSIKKTFELSLNMNIIIEIPWITREMTKMKNYVSRFEIFLCSKYDVVRKQHYPSSLEYSVSFQTTRTVMRKIVLSFFLFLIKTLLWDWTVFKLTGYIFIKNFRFFQNFIFVQFFFGIFIYLLYHYYCSVQLPQK